MATYEELLTYLELVPIIIAAERQQRAMQEERFALWRSHHQLCGGPPQCEAPMATLQRVWALLTADEQAAFLKEQTLTK